MNLKWSSRNSNTIINNRIIISNQFSILNGTSGSDMSKKIVIDHLMYLNDFNIKGYVIPNKKLKKRN